MIATTVQNRSRRSLEQEGAKPRLRARPARKPRRGWRPQAEFLEGRELLNSAVSVATEMAQASEIGPTPGIFRFTRTGDLSSPLQANFSLGGTAQPGVDYQVMDKTAAFDAGSDTAYVTVLPRNDALKEGNETVTLTLTPSAGYTVGTTASATATIADAYVPGLPGVFHAPNPTLPYGMTYLEATTANGQLQIKFSLSSRVAFSSLTFVNFFLDTDQNPTTGNLPVHHVSGPEYRVSTAIFSLATELGLDNNYFLDQLPSSPGATEDQTVPHDFRPADGVVKAQGGFYVLNVPLSKIGNPAAVDVFAYVTDGDSGGDIRPAGVPTSQGQGDRAPEFGAIDSSTGMVVVRKPAPTKIATVTDPAGDAHGGSYDLTGALFATIADQFITSLSFSQPINPSYGTLEGRMVVDSDQSLSTGDLPLTGNIPLGTGIPTWGGDAALDFRIDSLTGPSFTLSHDAFYDPSSDPLVDFGGDYNDGRWAYSGNTLTMTSSLSTFDPVLTKVHLAVDPNTGQVVPDEDLSSRIPTDGRMYASLSLNDSYTFQAYDLLPDTAGVVDTATGRVVSPLTWDPAKTVSADDPREFGNDFPTSMDLTRVDAEVTQGNLVVKGVVSGWLDTESNNEFLVLLDTDMNAATGARESNPENGGQEIGADYLVAISSSLGFAGPVFSATLLPMDPTATSHDAWLNHETSSQYGVPGSFTVTIPLKELKGVGPQLRLYVKAGHRNTLDYSDPGIQTDFTDTAPPFPIVLDTGVGPNAPLLQFSTNAYTVNEGAGTAAVTVKRYGDTTTPVSVNYATGNGTATAGSDYVSTSGTLTFNAGETSKTIAVPIIDDKLNEPDETFNLTLSSPTAGGVLGSPSTAVLTIVDNDPPPTISIADVSSVEGNSGTKTFNFTVNLSGPCSKPITVKYATVDGSAITWSNDYAATSGTLTFDPGQTSKTIPVTVYGDTAVESDETFYIILSAPTNATIAQGRGVGTILNDDVTIQIGNATVTEGNSGSKTVTFPVTLSAATIYPVTVRYTTVNGTATAGSDYAATSGTLTFSFTKTNTIAVTVYGDTIPEPDETFYVNLSAPTNAIIANGQGQCTILNDDGVPTVVTPASATPSPATGTTTTLSVLGGDDGGEANLKYTWTATTLPAGASAATFSVNGSNAAKKTVATFSKAGTYGFTVTIADAGGLTTTSSVNVVVNQSLTSIAVSPASVAVNVGGTQQFAATVRDQFGNVLATQPSFTWAATAGTITSGGLFTAPKTTGSVTVTATSGSFKSSASVNVTNAVLNLQDQALANLVQSLDADGSINRQDMIQILQCTGSDDGVVDAAEFGDLKTILNNAGMLNIPGYVNVLAGDVVNGNTANAYFQGQVLGNLAAGSSASQLNELVGKWFLGADHPAPYYYDQNGLYHQCQYSLVAGSLFVNGPAYTDMHQGALGDCYLIAALGSLAQSSPAVIQNMIVDNGDNTWTVRFYANGTPDYVTVDRMLLTEKGNLVFDDYGASSSNAGNELWIPLVEKAYAEWNETGKEGRNGQNNYPSISGGLPGDVYTQILGHGAYSSFSLDAAAKQVMINSLASNKAVTIGTNSSSSLLVAGHAYAVIGYDSATDIFTLYNPWGTKPPDLLSWSQLQVTCFYFAMADPSGTVPISIALAQPTAHAVIAPPSELLMAVLDMQTCSVPVLTRSPAPTAGSTARGANLAGSPMMACAFDTASPAPSSPLPSDPMPTSRAVPALVIAAPEVALPMPLVLTEVPHKARAAHHHDCALDALQQHDFDLSWVA